MISDKRLNEAISRHEEMLVRYLESEPEGSLNPTTLNIANIMAAIGMYRSSKRLECLSLVLIALTVVLAVLTATLVWRTFVK